MKKLIFLSIILALACGGGVFGQDASAAPGTGAAPQPAAQPATAPAAQPAAAPAAQTPAKAANDSTPVMVSAPVYSPTPSLTPTQQYVLDWSNRSLGMEYNPRWLQKMVQGDSSDVRANLKLPDTMVMRLAVATSLYKNNAETIADVNYASQLANELKRTVLSQTGGTLSGSEFKALNSAISAAKVTIVGHRRLLDFWQLIETRNTMTGERSREYVYYIVYGVDENNWDGMINNYVKELLGYIPAEKVRSEELAKKVAEKTAADNVLDQRSVLDQLRSQISALEQQMSADAQQKAYSSGDEAAAAAASISPDDRGWIEALIKSTNTLFE
ncbi:MAG: hypothetical protein LBM77_09935 [Spirochaetaceae bacterium]|jgi:hypothetical protein|nr:hypothetical protein [Spirochaetaceae bacterium]